MIEGIYIAASGGTKQLKKLDTISNNLANITTQGFKRDLLIYEQRTPPFGENSSFGTGLGELNQSIKPDPAVAYVMITGGLTDFSQGSLINTENPLDVAIEGDGFFVLDTPAGIRYTRNGTFHLDGSGQLVDRSGNFLMTQNDETILIPIDTDSISIDQGGTVFGGRGIDLVALAQLKIVQFNDNRGLVKEGKGMYINQNTYIQGKPLGEVKVLQGFLEKSNVNAVQEMTQMIETLRTLEAYQKIIQSIDEADDQSVNNLARVA